jgi:hypothetical protein
VLLDASPKRPQEPSSALERQRFERVVDRPPRDGAAVSLADSIRELEQKVSDSQVTAFVRELEVTRRRHDAAVDPRLLAYFSLGRLGRRLTGFDVPLRENPMRAFVFGADDEHFRTRVRCSPHDSTRLLHQHRRASFITAASARYNECMMFSMPPVTG